MNLEDLLAELANWPEYTQVYAGTFALVQPPIFVPLFLGAMAGRNPAEKRAAATVGSLGFLAAMVVFTFLGPAVLAVFGISIAAFQLAGGLLLLLIAIDMMRGGSRTGAEAGGDDAGGSRTAFALGIVPISIPILAGPGAITAVVLFATEHDGVAHLILVALVEVAVATTVFALLRSAVVIDRLFTPTAAMVFNKLMGLILAATAFEFLMHGIAAHFVQLDVVVH